MPGTLLRFFFLTITLFNYYNSTIKWLLYYPHFIDGETKAPKAKQLSKSPEVGKLLSKSYSSG